MFHAFNTSVLKARDVCPKTKQRKLERIRLSNQLQRLQCCLYRANIRALRTRTREHSRAIATLDRVAHFGTLKSDTPHYNQYNSASRRNDSSVTSLQHPSVGAMWSPSGATRYFSYSPFSQSRWFFSASNFQNGSTVSSIG